MKTEKNLMTCLKEKSSSWPHVSVGKFSHLGDPLAHP